MPNQAVPTTLAALSVCSLLDFSLLLQQDGLLTFLTLLVVCVLNKRSAPRGVARLRTRLPSVAPGSWYRAAGVSAQPRLVPFGHQVAPHASPQLLRDPENLPRSGQGPDPAMRMSLSDLAIHKILLRGGEGLFRRPIPLPAWTHVTYTTLSPGTLRPACCVLGAVLSAFPQTSHQVLAMALLPL